MSAVSASQAVIIGGGVSGLSAAYYLAQAGIETTVLEKSDRFGGLIGTDVVAGCQLERGPDSFISTKPSVQELAASLGIADRIISSNDARRKILIARKSRLQALPSGMIMMAPADLSAALRSPFFSLRTKWQFLRETRFRPRRREDDVSLAQFVLDHFDAEVLETVAEPLLTGVYGGDPGQLSVESVLPRFLGYEQTYGSLIRGVRQERRARKHSGSLFRSFQGGMQTLTDALLAEVTKRSRLVAAEAEWIEPASGNWIVHTPAGPLRAAAVILAVPAWSAANLLASLDSDLAPLLGAIPYSSAILCTFVFDRRRLTDPLDAFGFLVPAAERDTIAAATWINTKFPERLPADKAAIRTFIVGEKAEQFARASEGEVLASALADLRRWMRFDAQPLFQSLQRWPNSMPQYTIGHSDRVRRLFDRIRSHPGLYLCGNAYDGVGIPDCIRVSKRVSVLAASYCKSQNLVL